MPYLTCSRIGCTLAPGASAAISIQVYTTDPIWGSGSWQFSHCRNGDSNHYLGSIYISPGSDSTTLYDVYGNNNGSTTSYSVAGLNYYGPRFWYAWGPSYANTYSGSGNNIYAFFTLKNKSSSTTLYFQIASVVLIASLPTVSSGTVLTAQHINEAYEAARGQPLSWIAMNSPVTAGTTKITLGNLNLIANKLGISGMDTTKPLAANYNTLVNKINSYTGPLNAITAS